MFAKQIVLSDAFLDMPIGARCLYMTLGMVADDDGFVNSPRSVMRQCGAVDDDMKILIAKKFVLLFEDGVIVIKHWRINNYLRSDRYQETKYLDHKKRLQVENNGSYHMNDSGIPSTVYPDKDSIDKDSIGKVNSIGRFAPPTLEEVQEYITEKGYNIDAERFIDFYQSKGWMVGKNKMKDWKAAVRTWSKDTRQNTTSKTTMNNFTSSDTTEEDLDDWSQKNQDDFYSRWGGKDE